MKKRLLTAWIIACMFICLVGQTPIVALADGDDTRVISVPEGLQELLINEAPEIQSEQTEEVNEIHEVQTEEITDTNETQPEQGGESITSIGEAPIAQDEEPAVQTDKPVVQNEVVPEAVTETPAEAQVAQNTNTVDETPECIEQTVDADLPQGVHNYGDIVRVSGLLPKDAIVEAIPVNVEIEGQSVLLAYDITIYENEEKKNTGISWQPDENGLSVEFISTALEETEEEVNIWHMEDVEETPEYVTAAPSTDGSVEFVAESFSVYVVTETKLTATIVASDGNTYEINVTYDNKSGIPMEGTALKVDELKPGDDGYDEYIEESASKVGVKAENLEFSKVFDIKIVDENDETIEYEPIGDVDVSIRVIGVSLSDYPQVNVLHFVEQRNAESYLIYDVNSTVKEEAVEFTTDSFSVYVVIGHEGGEVVNPRVEFHFIADGSVGYPSNAPTYYEGTPYSFVNKAGDQQTTQILSNGDSLEMIADPTNHADPNDPDPDQYFYGWYIVDSYGNGIETNKITYAWPATPEAITFESAISITEKNVSIGEIVHWSINGISGSGEVDSNGNVHVLLAPMYEKYNFVNFMLRDRSQGDKTIMTRKLIARGSSSDVKVKISDIVSTSTDPVHLIFTGWEYNAGTESSPNWIQIPTKDYTGAEIIEPGEDGTYLTVNLNDTSGVDLYPIFVEARWVDFFVGVSGSGATYVPSRFLESWGSATPPGTTEENNKNIFTKLFDSNREGYELEGWYAFAVTDPDTGKILNLTEPKDVTFTYLDIANDLEPVTVTINTTAIKIANGDDGDSDPNDGDLQIVYNDTCYLVNNNGTGTLSNSGTESQKLFGKGDEANSLRLYNALDRLNLTANWQPKGTEFTIVYWTEDAQGKGFVESDIAEDIYSANKAITYTTSQLNAYYHQLTGNTDDIYSSGSEITYDALKSYGLLDMDVLSGVVPDNERKFFELVAKDTVIGKDDKGRNVKQQASTVINGDGKTVYNVYYNRMEFTLVFHIGRDGYVKTNGQQKPEMMTNPPYNNWDGNWIQFMFDDNKVKNTLGYTPGPTAKSYSAHFTMTYNKGTADTSDDEVYTTDYVTNNAKVKGDYLPEANEDVYVIKAKYGAYIGDRWPTPVNPNFSFTHNNAKSMYIWAAYYGSLYCRIANERSNTGNSSGNNPDINGVYEYMSEELCSNREGTEVINDNHVHHLVAWYGDTGKAGITKHYHVYIEAIDGTYDPNTITTTPGSDFLTLSQTTWSVAEGDVSYVDGHTFFNERNYDVISNLEPQFQLGTEIDGYELKYSCYETPQANDHHIYFFYVPKQYTLTFMYDNGAQEDTYFYNQSLADALANHPDPVKEGHVFMGWYTNEAGQGEKFDFNTTMPSHNIVLYPRLDINQYTIKIDPNGGVIDGRVNTSMSTYFTADYGTQVGEYTLDSREYIKLSDIELDSNDSHFYTGERYYYINTQRKGIPSEGEWGLPSISASTPSSLRNAVFVPENQIDAYYAFYESIIDGADTEYWEGITKLSKSEFLAEYSDGLYRRLNNGEKFTFMGWYQVYDDGSVASMPYNFNDPVSGPLELRAQWRLDGGYYVQYNPSYYVKDSNTNEVIEICGEIVQWMDPVNPQLQRYADCSPTNILRAPTNTTPDWVFRGWRVVRANGTDHYTNQNTGLQEEYIIWEPIQIGSNGEPIYYQPGDSFIIDSELVTDSENGIIHMQAYYEPISETYRRPDVTNLILDANKLYGGKLNDTDSTNLPVLNGPGRQSFNNDMSTWTTNDARTQILIGDLQSNLALHLYRYATNKIINGVQGTNFFENENGYYLIGFDESNDPLNLTTGEKYIPTYAPDSIAAVTKNETNKKLYAIWEPMVYATFVNTTAEDLVIDLSGTGGAINIVNKVTGEFDRESVTTQITVPAKSGTENGEVKVVLPGAVPGTDSITATAKNSRIGYKLSVSGVFDTQDPYGTGSTDIYYDNYATYTGTLQTDPNGIIVTYSEDEVPSVVFDVNDGDWNETNPAFEQSSSDPDIFTIKEDDINDINRYKPADPTRAGKEFIGWTTNADIAAQTDFSSEDPETYGSTTINPDNGEIVLDKVKSDYLWDFSQPAPYGQILYAVWSDTVTVTFDIVGKSNNLHTWVGPATTSTQGLYVYYRSSNSSGSITYTMAKGERVPKPSDPTTNQSGWNFVSWLLNETSRRDLTKNPSDPTIVSNTYDFSQRVMNNITLSTSWTTTTPQIFTFTVENQVTGNPNEEFNYTIAVSDEKVYGKIGTSTTNKYGDPDRKWGSVTTSLKNNETYTVQIKVLNSTKWNPNTYSIEIDVFDRKGNLVKSGHVVYCNNNTVSGDYAGKNFTSDYKYFLTIVQDEKVGYDTTVGVKDRDNIDLPPTGYEEISNLERKYTFASIHCGTSAQSGNFSPLTNEFTGDESNSITVVFTNTGTIVPAPTNYSTNYKPFFMMFGFGALLVGLIVPPVLMFRRRREEEE